MKPAVPIPKVLDKTKSVPKHIHVEVRALSITAVVCLFLVYFIVMRVRRLLLIASLAFEADGHRVTGPNGDLACTRKNEDLARMFCSAGRDFHELCTFFTLGSIQKFCTKQAGKKIAAVAKMPFTAAHTGYKSVKNYLFGSK